MISSIRLRNAAGSAPRAGTTSTDRMTPRADGISSKRHDNPVRSGACPAARGTANSPRFIAVSAQPSRRRRTSHRRHWATARTAPPERRGPARAPRDRHQRHPHRRGRGRRATQVAVAASASRAALEIVRRHREARAVAAEHEGKFAVVQRIGDRRDHRRAGHVDGLVALRRDRPGRFHDIGDADDPVVRQRRIQRRVHQAGKAAKDRDAGVEGVAAGGCGHGCDWPCSEVAWQIRPILGFGFKALNTRTPLKQKRFPACFGLSGRLATPCNTSRLSRPANTTGSSGSSPSRICACSRSRNDRSAAASFLRSPRPGDGAVWSRG